jgi:hypothetical protein
VAAYQRACRDGIDPQTFWELTPYQTRIAVTGLRDGRATLAWYIAALERQRKLPTLEQLLSKKGPESSGRELIETIRRHKRTKRG